MIRGRGYIRGSDFGVIIVRRQVSGVGHQDKETLIFKFLEV